MESTPDREQDLIHPNATEFFQSMTKDSEHYAMINNLQIYYECANTADKIVNTAVILVHGWTANRLRLHPLYQQLVEDHIPVFRIDLRGHGWSQKEGTVDYSFASMADDLDQFIRNIILDQFGFSKVIIIAHSMGGSLAQILAIQEPKYLDKLVLIATSCNWTDKPFQNILFWFYIEYYKRNFWKKYLRKKSGHEPWVLEHFPMWDTVYNTHGRTLFTSYHATIHGLQNMGHFDVRDQLHKITVPTLILVGDLDIDAPPRHSEVLHSLIPQSELVIVPDANHDVVIGKALTVYRIIQQFLTGSQ
ncbi:MAG: alpha/beta hydrolase [Promethearchaeota archaeon]|nr:MAG: alpha/beta hydrolase [Candidatus Lokiarchaeota archaeon]